MNWIDVQTDNEVPINSGKTLIVEDVNGWIGQAYWNDYTFVLETFNQVSGYIEFDKIKRYILI